jgi:nucleotide-binding universal stress UspA family protein
MKKILVATDFSPHSEAGLDLALTLLTGEGASITLLHVCQVPTYAYFGGGAYVPSPELVETILDDAKRGLAALSERVTKRGIPVEAHAVVGDPAMEIVRWAHEHGCDLIVVGTHGRRGFRRFMLGSVAERVVRTAEMPVLSAHHTTEEART